MSMSKETEQKIQQLQMMEQNLNNFLSQKQQFQAQLIEADSALSELKKTKKSYKIIGNIMVAADQGDLEKEVLQKKEMLELRIKSIEKQENKIKEKTSELQKDVLKRMEDEK